MRGKSFEDSRSQDWTYESQIGIPDGKEGVRRRFKHNVMYSLGIHAIVGLCHDFLVGAESFIQKYNILFLAVKVNNLNNCLCFR